MSRSPGVRFCTGFSSMVMAPVSMVSSPAIARSVVVLPQPDGPSSTTNSRSAISRLSRRIT